jgi:signal transduction histidine kinase
MVRLGAIPTPVLCIEGMRCIAANPAYEALMGFDAAEVVGKTIGELVDFVALSGEAAFMEARLAALEAGGSNPPSNGRMWCRVTDKLGHVRPLRVQWTLPDERQRFLIFLLDETQESTSQTIAESLARAGGELVHAPDERDVLERAADALFAQGFSITFLLLDGDSEELTYGPRRARIVPSVRAEGLAAFAAFRPARAVLERVNPGFHQRRAAFVHEAESTVRFGYPEAAREVFERALAGSHLVQAPLFVEGVAHGAMVVYGPTLTPSRAATIEMFAELVARALESVRSRQRAQQRLEELERLQAELLERERLVALGEAAAVMAHEVRNPIAAISNALAVLRRQPAPSSEGADMLRVIGEEAARLERVVRHLLDLGRPLTPQRHSIDLLELATDCVRTLRDRNEVAGVQVVVRAGSEVFATVDPDLLQLALLNVLQNAVQVTPAGGTVVVELAAGGIEGVDGVDGLDGERATIAVEDEGPGFSDELVRRMFEPFFTTRPSGTGIGLAVVRRTIEANGGTIALGRGARGGGRFEISFAREGR